MDIHTELDKLCHIIANKQDGSKIKQTIYKECKRLRAQNINLKSHIKVLTIELEHYKAGDSNLKFKCSETNGISSDILNFKDT